MTHNITTIYYYSVIYDCVVFSSSFKNGVAHDLSTMRMFGLVYIIRYSGVIRQHSSISVSVTN